MSVSMNKIVKPNNLHGRKLFELVPINVQVPNALHLFLLLRLAHDLLNCLVQNVVRVPIYHITFALVISIFRQDILIGCLTEGTLLSTIFVKLKEIGARLPCLFSVTIGANLPLLKNVINTLKQTLIKNFLLLLPLLVHLVLLLLNHHFLPTHYVLFLFQFFYHLNMPCNLNCLSSVQFSRINIWVVYKLHFLLILTR